MAAILVAGSVLIGLAVWWDGRKRAQALTAPPPIGEVSETPGYLTEDEAYAPAPELFEHDWDEIYKWQEDAEHLRISVADERLIAPFDEQLFPLYQPLVAVAPEGIGSVRELMTLIRAAKRASVTFGS